MEPGRLFRLSGLIGLALCVFIFCLFRGQSSSRAWVWCLKLAVVLLGVLYVLGALIDSESLPERVLPRFP